MSKTIRLICQSCGKAWTDETVNYIKDAHGIQTAVCPSCGRTKFELEH